MNQFKKKRVKMRETKKKSDEPFIPNLSPKRKYIRDISINLGKIRVTCTNIIVDKEKKTEGEVGETFTRL